MNKFIIVFLFISTLFSQNVDGEFSLGEISFLIKTFILKVVIKIEVVMRNLIMGLDHLI